ncbi:hypothetical protein C0993_006874 [Termitomyces sp. T159_Od127]|nr:hypothetical protein C0993_006874 [Termitomyces sp. T159_Od127]
MRNPPELLHAALQYILDYNPPPPVVQEDSPCPRLTHPLTIYDTHIDRRLALKRVKLVPTFLEDLAKAVDLVIEKVVNDDIGLPSVEGEDFPTPESFSFMKSPYLPKDAYGITQSYRNSISLFACKMASMLLLHPTAATWSTAIGMALRITSRNEKYYTLVEDCVPEILGPYEMLDDGIRRSMIDQDAWEVLSDDDRRDLEAMRKKFPGMALWQMFFPHMEIEDMLKNISGLADMDVFPEITPLTVVTHWPSNDAPFTLSPDSIKTSWKITVASWLGITGSPHIGDLIQSPVRLPVFLQRSTRNTMAKPKGAEHTKKTEETVKQEKSGLLLPLSKTTSIPSWPNVKLPAKRDLHVIDKGMTTSLIQHVIFFLYHPFSLVVNDLVF